MPDASTQTEKYDNYGYIYKLVSPFTDEVYYGSTTQQLSMRKATHKAGRNNTCSSKQLFQEGNVEIILVELFPCNTKEELLMRERFYIENNECVNKRIPGRTQKEYYQKNKEKLSEQMKEYYENNKEQICEQKKEYRQKNKEKLSEKMKEYYENNKEQISEQRKEYYENNKEQISEQQKKYQQNNKDKLNAKIICECGGKYQRTSKTRHLRTKKHINFT